nr:MAG TPA: hypothetical protein [Caudoviricetes sp.]
MVVPLRSQVRLRYSLLHWAYFALLRPQGARFVRPLAQGSLWAILRRACSLQQVDQGLLQNRREIDVALFRLIVEPLRNGQRFFDCAIVYTLAVSSGIRLNQCTNLSSSARDRAGRLRNAFAGVFHVHEHKGKRVFRHYQRVNQTIAAGVAGGKIGESDVVAITFRCEQRGKNILCHIQTSLLIGKGPKEAGTISALHPS